MNALHHLFITGSRRLIRRYLDSSLKSKMLLLFFTLIMSMLLAIGITSFKQYSQVSTQRTITYNHQVIKQVIRNINYFTDDMDSIVTFANYNTDIQALLQETSSSSAQNFSSTIKNIELLDDIVSQRPNIASIFILGRNKRVIGNTQNERINQKYDFFGQAWYRQAVENPGESNYISPHKQNYVVGSSKYVISLCRSINSFDTKDVLGVMMIDLNLQALDDICRNVQLGKNGYIFVVDQLGNQIFHPGGIHGQEPANGGLTSSDEILISAVLGTESGSFTQEFHREVQQITYQKIDSTGWVVVAVTPYREIIDDISKTRNSLILIGIICLMVTFLITLLISAAITRPLRDLEKRMEAAEQGDLAVSSVEYPHDEVGKLSRKMDSMLAKISGLMQDVVHEQESKRKSEMKALQAQINPHFLYNTLDSIVWMAETNNRDVVLMTEALARLFRITLSRGEDQISLEQELEHVRNYLIIQSIRYVNKFDYSITCDTSLYSCRVLKLILQPLVENSIYHGVKSKRQMGQIRITARDVERKLLIEVTDNGIGMTPEKAANLLFESEPGRRRNQGGIGVLNVHERIQLYYGQEYGLKFISMPGEGTTVQIWLPLVCDSFAENYGVDPDEKV